MLYLYIYSSSSLDIYSSLFDVVVVLSIKYSVTLLSILLYPFFLLIYFFGYIILSAGYIIYIYHRFFVMSRSMSFIAAKSLSLFYISRRVVF